MKKKIFKLIAVILSFFDIIPINVNADNDIIRKKTNNYFTTINFVGTYTNESTGAVENFERTSQEISGNYDLDAVLNYVLLFGMSIIGLVTIKTIKKKNC